jgi:hypothetical protein
MEAVPAGINISADNGLISGNLAAVQPKFARNLDPVRLLR